MSKEIKLDDKFSVRKDAYSLIVTRYGSIHTTEDSNWCVAMFDALEAALENARDKNFMGSFTTGTFSAGKTQVSDSDAPRTYTIDHHDAMTPLGKSPTTWFDQIEVYGSEELRDKIVTLLNGSAIKFTGDGADTAQSINGKVSITDPIGAMSDEDLLAAYRQLSVNEAYDAWLLDNGQSPEPIRNAYIEKCRYSLMQRMTVTPGDDMTAEYIKGMEAANAAGYAGMTLAEVINNLAHADEAGFVKMAGESEMVPFDPNEGVPVLTCYVTNRWISSGGQLRIWATSPDDALAILYRDRPLLPNERKVEIIGIAA